MQDDVVILSEPVDLLLTCVRQVLLLAKPREKQIPDSIVGAMGGNTTPSILRPAAEASQDTNPTQVMINCIVAPEIARWLAFACFSALLPVVET